MMLWLWHISRNVAVNIKRACNWHVYQNSQVLWNADLIIKNNYRLITSSRNLLGIHFYVKYVIGLHSRFIAIIMWFISVTHQTHYDDVIMSAMASQITSPTIVYSTVYSRHRSKKHQSSASLAFMRGIQRWPVNSPNKGPVTRKMFPFDDVIMIS